MEDPLRRVLRLSTPVTILVLAGCSAAIPLPTHLDGPAAGGVGIGGTLGGDAPCLWLGNGGQSVVVIWPAGFTALENPVSVVAPDRRIIATVGDTIEGGGDGRDRGPVPGCGIPSSLALTEISSVNGRPMLFPTPGPRHQTRPVEPR
jgi:hypothetical protein